MENTYTNWDTADFRHDIAELVRAIPLDRLVGDIRVRGSYIKHNEDMSMGDFENSYEPIKVSTKDPDEVIRALQHAEPKDFLFQASFGCWYFKPTLEVSTKERKIGSVLNWLGYQGKIRTEVSFHTSYRTADPYTGELRGSSQNSRHVTLTYRDG